MSTEMTKYNHEDFGEILSIVEKALKNAFRAVNRELISMYWDIGWSNNLKHWHTEEYSFKISIVSVGDDGSARHCRNGHEPGDTYICKYGCPMPQNSEGGFCSKSMFKLFPLM